MYKEKCTCVIGKILNLSNGAEVNVKINVFDKRSKSIFRSLLKGGEIRQTIQIRQKKKLSETKIKLMLSHNAYQHPF